MTGNHSAHRPDRAAHTAYAMAIPEPVKPHYAMNRPISGLRDLHGM